MPTIEEDKKKEIVDALYWDSRVDASDITVMVDGTNAILNGTVPSSWVSDIAEKNTLSVSGILSVENLLIVNYLHTGPSDADIKSNIENTLLWNPTIDSLKIRVSVDVGIVTLKGDVDAYWKMWRAEELVRDMNGVLKVHNALAVVPTGSYLDKNIAEQIVNSLERSSVIDPDMVTVTVKLGKVTLTGKVSSWVAKNSAYTIASFTTGVISVKNKIIVV